LLCALAFLAATIAAGAPAVAQRSSGPRNAVQGFSENRDKPVKIRAASLIVRDKDKIATFSGDVHVTQGDTELFCKSLVVYYEADALNGPPRTEPAQESRQEIRRMDAKGGIRVVRKDQVTTADSGIFDIRANTVTLVGNVVVTRGQDVVRGPRLVVDLNSGVSRMEAGGGRVEGLFQSSPRSNEPPTGSARPRAN
jgi:lipopolysaccharide export system protein LptA